ncbi:MAG: C2H2-type zinc finger protein [Candidatus Hodarchaeales archaeon]|jgi:DNA-directed RNA polymerase subunit RPC12/RpoP
MKDIRSRHGIKLGDKIIVKIQNVSGKLDWENHKKSMHNHQEEHQVVEIQKLEVFGRNETKSYLGLPKDIYDVTGIAKVNCDRFTDKRKELTDQGRGQQLIKREFDKHFTHKVDSSSMYKCDTCWKEYTTKNSLKRHVEAVHEGVCFKCDTCGKEFTRSDYFRIILRSNSFFETKLALFKTCGDVNKEKKEAKENTH